MREEFEDKPTSVRRFSEEDALTAEAPTARLVAQSLDTLKENYNWIAHFQLQHPHYDFHQFDDVPWTEFQGLSEARVALLTTAGVYIKGQRPFSVFPEEVSDELTQYKFRVKGDPSFRLIPIATDARQLLVAHSNLDSRGADQDINIVFPIDRLRELEEENFIGSTASTHFSFMGFLPNPADLQSSIPQILAQLRRDEVSAVVLTPGEILSHQTMCVLQCAIEEAGIATVSIGLCRDIIEYVGVPRAVHYRFPFGFTLGDVNDEAMQLRILKDTLRVLEEAEEPATIIELPYEWVETD